jgi:hypothetical protein
MLLYNVTVGIDKAAEAEWLAWMRAHYIPTVMGTGYFKDCKMYRVQHDQGEDTVSYSVQVFASTIEDVLAYLDKSAPAIMETLRVEFRNRHIVFQTLLEEVPT